MSTPVPEEQLLALGSKAKITVGLSLLVGGIGATIALWDRGWIYGATIFLAVMGLGLVLLGREERRQEKAIDAEVERAESEWQDLAREIGAARDAGVSASRLLQQKGYSRAEVRRWILDNLDPARLAQTPDRSPDLRSGEEGDPPLSSAGV